MLAQLSVRFRDEERSHTVREDLSAVQLTDDGYLWLASDEFTSLERLQWNGTCFDRHESFELGDFFDLPAGTEREIDMEGLGIGESYLWLTGSHSRKIKKPKPCVADAKNIRRLTWTKTQTEPNRFLLGRIPLVDGELGASYPNSQRHGCPLTAASVAVECGSTALVEALKHDPHIGPYVAMGIPGKANGLDIEGLEVLGDRVFLGLRGPVLLDWAILLELELKEQGEGTLVLRKIGPKNRPYRKHFVNLRGLGVRDLCRVGEDLLILAGPTLYLDGPARVYCLRDAGQLEDGVMHRPELLLEIPCGVGVDHPEGITWASQLTGRPSVLVMYDAPCDDRKREPNAVLADVFLVPC